LSALLAIGVSSARAPANETDQFLLPLDKPMADVGRCLSRAHYEVLETVTRRLNDQIRSAQAMRPGPRRTAELERLHAPRVIANKVREAFGPGFFETIGLENSLDTKSARRALGERGVGAYKRFDWIYAFGHLPIDPRNIPMLLPSSTIKAYGVYFGTDKLGHFHDLGHYYFCDYLSKRNSGKSEEQAVREVVAFYSRGVLAETTTIGFLATGICSNADLLANYMGFKFYRNLTEPVMLKGSLSPPLLVQIGGYWELNTHVRPDSDFFEPFVSDHWNEALNPCVYEWGLRWTVARRLRDRADEVLGFYCGIDQRPREARYFADLAVELSSYYAENYGYFGNPAEIMSIATTCFSEQERGATEGSIPPGSPGTAPAASSTSSGQ
jgi:hypothetical protein